MQVLAAPDAQLSLAMLARQSQFYTMSLRVSRTPPHAAVVIHGTATLLSNITLVTAAVSAICVCVKLHGVLNPTSSSSSNYQIEP
jgi:hypothetical protein